MTSLAADTTSEVRPGVVGASGGCRLLSKPNWATPMAMTATMAAGVA